MSSTSRNHSKDLYCPLSMTRFDSSDNVTIWKCQLCEKHLLSKDSARQHLSKCPRTIIIDSINIADFSDSDTGESNIVESNNHPAACINSPDPNIR